jgi:hypothetical protein
MIFTTLFVDAAGEERLDSITSLEASLETKFGTQAAAPTGGGEKPPRQVDYYSCEVNRYP